MTPPPPDHDAEAEIEEQAVDHSVGKKPWTKPIITEIDDLEHILSGPNPDTVNENFAYYPLSA